MFKRKGSKKMIDREPTRPRRLASERAKAYFLSDASISKQLEKEERDLRKALKVSRMEALRARRNGNESKSVKSSSLSTASTSSSKSLSSASSSSSSSSPLSPLLTLPTTPKTSTKVSRTASSPVNQKHQTKMGKPKVMELSAKTVKTMNRVKPTNDVKPKSKIMTRSQNTNDITSTNQHVNYSPKSNCVGQTFNCDKQPNHSTYKPNGSTKGTSSLSSSKVPCATLSDGINCVIPIINGENCDKPRPKIMAQRKFASITYNCNPYLKPRDTEFSPIKELFTKHKPSAEDFLTFLCFKSTDLLPPHLDFYSLNNIKSQDGSNVLPNDLSSNEQTANGTDADNVPTKSTSKHQPSNAINLSSTSSSTTNRNVTNGKGQSVRKRATTHPVEKELDLMDSSKSNTQANRRNGTRSSNKNGSNLDTGKSNQRTNRTVKIVNTRACKQQSTIKSTRTDENIPKKSVQPLKRPPKSTSIASHRKSPTKMKINSPTKERANSRFNDTKTLSHCSNEKVSAKPEPKISNSNSENNDKAKVNCDRILRSTRSSSSILSSTTISCSHVEPSLIVNGKHPNENSDEPVMMKEHDESAINGIPIDNSGRKRKCDGTAIAVGNDRKRAATTTRTSLSLRQPKKDEVIELQPIASTSNSRKGSTRPVTQRIETRSHTKR